MWITYFDHIRHTNILHVLDIFYKQLMIEFVISRHNGALV